MGRVLHPFRGIRYAQQDSRDLSRLITPPYDVISAAMRDELYARDEHNFIRIELGREPAPGEPPDGRYARAADTLRRWLAEGVLAREPERAFYLLEQQFALGGRTWRRRGVLGLVRLPERGQAGVLSHEGTLPAPKADRLALMRACRAMTSPILSMVEDDGALLLRTLWNLASNCDATARDGDGVLHRLQVIQEPDALEAIRDAVGAGPVFIADGHHRFETAIAYRDEMRQAHPDAPKDAGFNHALMLITSARDEAVKILPTHRLISGLGEAGVREMMSRIRDSCEVHEWPLPDPTALGSQPWLEGMSPERHAFGAYCGDGKYYVLILRDEVLPKPERVADALDVTVLHRHLIEPVVDQVGAQRVHLSYVVHEEEAIQAVARGECDFALFLRPTRVSDVLAAARAGERMPGKSTYFYPKVPAGLVVSDASEAPI